MNLKVLAPLLGVVIVIIACFQLKQPFLDIKKEYDNIAVQKQAYEATIPQLEKAKREADQRKAQLEKAREDLKKNQKEPKPVYRPIYTKGNDTALLFGKPLKDVIELAKKSRLRMNSMEVYSKVKNEPLLLGRDVSLNQILNESAVKSETPTTTTPYRAHQVDLGLLGEYKDLKLFLTAVENYEYLIKIKKVETLPYSKNPKILISNVSLVLYANVDKK